MTNASFTPGLGLGETVIGHLAHPAPSPPAKPVSAADRIRGRRGILECTGCALYKSCKAPVPWAGPAPNRLLVVGEAPGAVEDGVGIPFVGPAGKLLRDALRYLGFDPDNHPRVDPHPFPVTFANTVCCRPSFHPPTPRLEHINACAPHLARTLRIVAPSHVLVVGGTALSRFRADLKITAVRGRPFVVPSSASAGDGMWCFPIIHPSSILRDRTQEKVWREDLSRWAEIVADPLTWTTEHLPVDCIACAVKKSAAVGGGKVDRYDPDGISWCDTHYAKGYAGWQASAKKRTWMARTEMLQKQALDPREGLQGASGSPGEG